MRSDALWVAHKPASLLAGVRGALLVALITALVGGCGDGSVSDLPEGKQAVQTFEELHASIYDAFSEPNESAVYDALSESVDGKLLERVYREIYASLIAKEHGGVVSEILDVTPIETELVVKPELDSEGVPRFQVRAVWEVNSVASHEGHTHLRSHQYEALYLVAQDSERWRIVDDRILRQRRLGEAWQNQND